MAIGSNFCRAMGPGEEGAVAELLTGAFGGGEEARLVAGLRKTGAIAGEMVLPGQDGAIIGYYALSHFVKPKGWLCLAPVAIRPDEQGRGYGRRMIGQLAEWARLTGSYVVVLGQPEFYGKCGFSSARAAHLTSAYPVTHLLLAGPGEDVPQEALTYPKVFDQL